MGYQKVSIKFEAPKTILERYVTKVRNTCDETIDVIRIGAFKAVQEQEKELCEHVIKGSKDFLTYNMFLHILRVLISIFKKF